MKFVKKELINELVVITVKEFDAKTAEAIEAQYVNRDDVWYSYPDYNTVEGFTIQLNAWSRYRD